MKKVDERLVLRIHDDWHKAGRGLIMLFEAETRELHLSGQNS